MGVHATWCQLCGLPTQHDHYVPSASGMLRIYRGSSPGGGHDWSQEAEQPFAFTAQHAWLTDAVGVKFGGGVVRGPVEDGGLVDSQGGADLFVADGQEEDALVFHHFCWEAAGRPNTPTDAARGQGQHGWTLVERYQEQLFAFQAFAADGHAALLADPAGQGADAAASRERIEALLKPARS